MHDPTEDARRALVPEVNQTTDDEIQGETWDTERARDEFEFIGFMAPFAIVKHRDTGEKGTLMFRHSPRIYFDWRPDHG